MSLHGPAGACILRLQFMYFQYNMYLSIVVGTYIFNINIKHAHDPKQDTPAGGRASPASWGVKSALL